MPWLQLSVDLNDLGADRVEQALIELGAVAVSFLNDGSEPIFEPEPGTAPMWDRTRATGLFAAGAEREQILTRLGALLPTIRPAAVSFGVLEDRDWHATWIQSVRPTRFGRRLWVLPHADSNAPARACAIRLAPGVGFGTGDHPTTRMCLEWLDGVGVDGLSVADIGCGSGILAIAALALGARRALAVDVDPQALDAARANARRNDCLDRLAISAPEALPPGQRYDVVLANILSRTLIELSPLLRDLTEPGGSVVLAGILAGQVDEVRDAFSGWVELEVSATSDEWALLNGQRME